MNPDRIHSHWWLLLAALWTGAAGAADWYTIEVIVFEHLRGGGDEGPPAGESSAQAAVAPQDSPAIRRLRASQLRLGGVANALEREGGYRVLVHTGWRQAVPGRDAARPVPLESDDGRLTGSLKVGKGRFLHVRPDLVLSDYGDPTARMQQHRRMRSRELHYLDHPRVGLLIEARPVQTKPEASEPQSPSSAPAQAAPPDAASQ